MGPIGVRRGPVAGVCDGLSTGWDIVHRCVIKRMTRHDMLPQLYRMGVDCPRSVAGLCVHMAAAYCP